MSDAPTPPSGPLKLRRAARDFAVANPPASAPSPDAPTDVAGHLQAAATPRSDLSPAPPGPAENDVHALLRDNLAAAEKAGLHAVTPVQRRRSRRRRDYWIVLIGFDLLIVALVLLVGPNVVSLLFGFGGIVFFNLGLTWIMWMLVDDY